MSSRAAANMTSEKHMAWILPQATGLQNLKLDQEATFGPLAIDDVLVELHAASLNYRELAIAKGHVPGEVRKDVVLGSDGAGIVKAVGKNVSEFSIGDKVVTHMCSLPDEQFPTMVEISAGLGHTLDGTLRQFGHFPRSTLVHAPRNLGLDRAATLTCSGLTAFNALFGLSGREVKAGDWVLVQGTGGVSIAALQFGVAAGANVVATTSSDEKAKRLEALGAKHVVNYRSTPTWGEHARTFTPDQRGFDVVVEVGGNGTLPQSLKAVRTNGIVAVTGVLSGLNTEPVDALLVLWHVCSTRGVILGTRNQFKDMVKFVEDQDIQPVLDDVVFGLEEADQAFQRLQEQKHFSKIVIKIR